MKLEDMGIDSETGHHNKVLTHAENCFLGLLWIDHAHEDNKISADELAILFSAAREGRSVTPAMGDSMLRMPGNHGSRGSQRTSLRGNWSDTDSEPPERSGTL